MASTRVYILAKELGVESSAIVKKCQDEELDVKNHMSTISAGLAATIREWFSEGDNVTAVEEAEKVDLEKVKLKRKPRRKAPKKEEQQEQVAAQPEAPEPVETQVQEQITQQAEPQPEPQIEIPKPEPVKQAE
ncbi:MAG: translation initiation factor IF-2 N-terminal domain-containing protein, partial [Phycisphaerae bacterium]